ncbi:MAG TPA: ankyrin repeat domain-containing protein [Thermoanaerobaculia bacterium]|nr:ankyrin repeat domain-containing protein [Thermoanaerobaculia bacterium]
MTKKPQRPPRSTSAFATLGALALAWLVAAFPSLAVATDTELAARSGAAVLRALPLLQSSADTWFRERPCASCHHQGLGMMAVSLARERGFPIDERLLAAQVQKTARYRFDPTTDLVLGEASINEAIGQSYTLLGIAAAGAPRGDALPLVAHLLAGKQHVSGKWSSYSHRPPLEDGEITATALTLRALRLCPPPGRAAEAAARAERARRWLESAQPVDGEDRAMQLLGLVWAGAASEIVTPPADRLWAEQRADGGWAQVSSRESDAYATGQALVTLHAAGVERPADFARGIEHLLRTQLDDGSWLVTTRRAASSGLPYFETGFPHGKHQFISYAGSAWATMALVLAAGDGTRDAILGASPHPPLAGVEDGHRLEGLPPLLRSALFGSLEDLETALSAGADPNAATPSGVTALMASVQDARKVAVLLAGGARVNASAKSGHTAPAAGYDGAGDSARLLLSAGANVHASTTDGIIQPATAFLRAVLRGDEQLATLLVARGASIVGSERQRAPLHIATWQDDVTMVSYLLDRGAPIEERSPTDDGSPGDTPLLSAAADGLERVARLLLLRGADPNARGADGYTALMYAAGTADRGSAGIVEALLAAGADPTIANEKGETAQSIAREFSHRVIEAALERAARGATERGVVGQP